MRDTHATPPQFIQEAYWHYNRIKLDDLKRDESVIDFGRGLSDEQKELLIPVRTILASTIESTCKAFRDKVLGVEGKEPLQSEIQDVVVYEHAKFPGLQIAPSILPPETQVLFVSQVLHKYLASPKHTTNLSADYDIDFPTLSSGSAANAEDRDDDQGDVRDPALAPLSSFFTGSMNDVPLQRKSPSGTADQLNSAQFLSKKLRYLTLGAQYHWPTRSYPSTSRTTFPSDLYALVTGHFPHIVPQSGVCLLYSGKDYMPPHRDVSENCQTGLASFSFGCDGLFVVAKGEVEAVDEEDTKRRTAVVRVRSGDCVHMDGESRWAWHAMPKIMPGTCPEWLQQWPALNDGDAEVARWTEAEREAFEKWRGWMGRKRLNVSCRQVY